MSRFGYTVIEVKNVTTRKLVVWGVTLKYTYVDWELRMKFCEWHPCQIPHSHYMEVGDSVIVGTEQDCKDKLDQMNRLVDFNKLNGVIYKVWYPTFGELDELSKLSDRDYVTKIDLLASQHNIVP